MLSGKIATVFGGTGFIGRYVVQELARLGYTIRIPTRYPADAGALRPKGVVGQIAPMACRLHDNKSIAAAVDGATLVVNLIGQLAESRSNSFEWIQAETAGRIARAAATAGVARYVHLSAIGADAASPSRYAASKAHGETQVREAIPEAVILRPSVVFGPEDKFFNRFGAMARLPGILPLIGGGKTRFQPVYVNDVAAAVGYAATHDGAAGKTYELGGPEIYTFRQLMELVLRFTDRHAALIPLPFRLANIQARVLEYVPGKPLTRDQVVLLKRDNVVTPGALKLIDMGITPTAAELILPTYLDRFAKGGRFHQGPHVEKYYS